MERLKSNSKHLFEINYPKLKLINNMKVRS